MAKKKQRALTAKQELFKNLRVKGVDKVEAYRQSYSVASMSGHAIHVEAARVEQNPIIAEAIRKAQGKVAEKAEITAVVLINELEEARQIAKGDCQPAAMVSATMGKAKLCGLDKIVVELQAAEELTPWSGIVAAIDKKDAT